MNNQGGNMNLIVPKTIKRDGLFNEYVNMQAEHASRMLGISKDKLVPVIQQIVREKYKPRRVELLVSPSYGNVKQVNQDFWSVIKSTETAIITPSGSTYKPTYRCQSIMSKMVTDKLAERKKVKKMQLKAAGAGDDILAKRCWYKQASIKVNINSMPGGFASPYNIFYDKGGYNSITSSARCMIARAYTICEQLLGGNFAWFSVEELVNFIVLQLRTMPSCEDVLKCMGHYGLRSFGKEHLMGFYKKTIARYCPGCDLTPVQRIIDTLNDAEINFLYYYCNLRHMIWENDGVFRPWIDNLFNVDNIEIDPNVTKDDAFKMDDTVSTLVTVAFTDKLGGYGLVDICNDHPEYIPKLVAYCRVTEKRLHELDGLMDIFVNTLADIPMTHLKPNTWRNTTIVSDTDSVIFTSVAWDDWYRHGEYGVNQQSYQISALVIYWLHHAVKFALKRFSIAFGYVPDETERLAMKNEFLFPVMMIYPIKKTYVGLQLIQEGVVFKKPKLDIKGQTLRGSSICAKSLAFSAQIMNEDILNTCISSQISGEDIIRKVVAFEQQIYDEIEHGNLEYLKITSLKYERDYTNPESTSVVVGWEFWEQVMTAKYDHIHPPTKVYVFKVTKPQQQYFDWLKKQSPNIHKQLMKYLGDKKKLPNQLVVDPVVGHIPEELIPLINKREVVYTNLSPVYSTLEQIGIAVGCKNQKLLFCDVYA